MDGCRRCAVDVIRTALVGTIVRILRRHQIEESGPVGHHTAAVASLVLDADGTTFLVGRNRQLIEGFGLLVDESRFIVCYRAIVAEGGIARGVVGSDERELSWI